MSCYFWTLIGVALLQAPASSSSQNTSMCESMMQRFNAVDVPEFCSQLGYRFNSTTYRINFTESEVESVCNSEICQDWMTDLILPCRTFPKRDINCLDSPGLIHVWCSNSNLYDNTSCFTSLTNQGVINTPNLFTPCLNALYNAESCPDYCRNIFMNADCCFVSYYAFMIDLFVSGGGFPVFEKTYFVNDDRFWNWCDVTSPGVCPGFSLDNLTDYSPRDNEVTCEFQPILINITTNTPNPRPTMSVVPSMSAVPSSSPAPTNTPNPRPTMSVFPSMSAVPSSSPTPTNTPNPRPTMSVFPSMSAVPSSSPAPTESPSGAIIQEPLIGLNILMAFTVWIAFNFY